MVFITAFPVNVLAVPGIDGSDPIYTQTDVFSAGDWAVTVYSYVYDNTSTKLPGTYGLAPGEMLFMYLLDYTQGTPIEDPSVDHFTVGNPLEYSITDIGYEGGSPGSIVPAGYDGDDFDEPYIFGYSMLAQESTFTYYGDFSDPWVTLDPGEYSLVYYIAVSDYYGPVPGSIISQGMSDTQFVPGPVCIVDFHHFGGFAAHWLDGDCNDLNNWCGGADLDYSGDVNLVDLDLFVDEWLDFCPSNWLL